MVIPKGHRSKYLKVDKLGVGEWLKLYNEVLDENVEIFDEGDVEIGESDEE